MDPLSAQMARENRQFLGRAVSYVAGCGIRQFIDVGAGLPTAVNTHGVLDFLDAAAAQQVATAFSSQIPAGSYLVISVGTGTENAVAADFRARPDG